MTRILIAEDEPGVSSLLEKGLRAAGYATTLCEDGIKAAAMAMDDAFDLLILDLGLPGQDGFAVLRAMRARGEQLPVLILTARVEVTDSVADLELGADDYVAKPFVFKQLLARVRACLNRGAERDGDAPVLEAGGVRLDVRSRRAETETRAVELSAKEAGPLEAFLRNPGDVLSRSSCSPRSGAMTTTRAPTSSTSTSGTCAASSARNASSPSAAWATRSTSPPEATTRSRRSHGHRSARDRVRDTTLEAGCGSASSRSTVSTSASWDTCSMTDRRRPPARRPAGELPPVDGRS
jgi:DNA-binding response OmpR family regulator